LAGLVTTQSSDCHSTNLHDKRRFTFLRWSWCCFVILLMVSTWRLWTDQHGFPQIPLLGLGHWLPSGLDVVIASVACCCCLATACLREPSRVRSGLYIGFAVAMGLLFSADQHRLQPWAYQFVIAAIVFACCDVRNSLKLYRWLIIGIYLYSAISKLDAAFFSSVGRELATTLLGFAGIQLGQLPIGLQNVTIGCLPVVELAVGLALLLGFARRPTVVIAIVMHLGLLLVLSPLGLNHKFGVLLWNACFLVQLPILFWPRNEVTVENAGLGSSNDAPNLTPLAARFAHGIVAIALILPALEPWGYCDHWLAWGLYAPRSSRVELYVHSNQLAKLPAGIPQQESSTWPSWHRLDLSQWSLAELSVPIYPQSRFQVGVAESLIEEFGLAENGIRLTLKSASHRFSGEREAEDISRSYQRENAVGRFWFGSSPR
jgi:uncharacterized membrane protein YphA (DoxX/SURF4 family)